MDIGAFIEQHKVQIAGAGAGIGLAVLYAVFRRGKAGPKSPAQYLTPDILASSPSGEVITITGPGNGVGSGGAGGTIVQQSPNPAPVVSPIAPAPPPVAPPPAVVVAPTPAPLPPGIVQVQQPIPNQSSPVIGVMNAAPTPGPSQIIEIPNPITGETGNIAVGFGPTPFIYGGNQQQVDMLVNPAGDYSSEFQPNPASWGGTGGWDNPAYSW